jgi:hypothetical protein
MKRPRPRSVKSGLTTLIRSLTASDRTWFGVYCAIALIATSICVARECNNFLIFRAAFDHLLAGRDMYAAYPREHMDLFKYSPTFALLFAPFAKLPFGAALLGWNLLNVVLLYYSLWLALPRQQRTSAIQILGIGLISTTDGTQSNGLVAALIILSFAALEHERVAAAAIAIVAGALIKLFPLSAALFALPRRDRWRCVAWLVAAGAAFVALPLAVTNGPTLAAQYRSWFALGSADALDRGASVMRLLHVVTSYDGPNWPIQLAGSLILVSPILYRPSRWSDPDFRRTFLGSVLVYAVIFNHKAEQPSFVLAAAGLGIWYAVSAPTPLRKMLVGSTLIATAPVLMAVAAPAVTPWTVDGSLLITCACCTAAWLTMQCELLELFAARTGAADAELAAIGD